MVATRAPLAMPRNVATRSRYSGVNVLILWGAVVQHGFGCQSWLTFRQAQSLGGNVRRGECGTTVVYSDRFVPTEEKRRASETGEDARAIPFLKRFTVFNADQCVGLPDGIEVAPALEPGLIEPRVRALIKASGIDFRIGGDRAFYAPTHDYVQVPTPQAFFDPINWHRTALHECSHASGAAHRLNRDLSGSFGSKKYAFEELVAEISATFCCAAVGIVPTVRHADYIGSWAAVLREDNRAIVRAASQASTAADFLLGFLPAGDQLADGIEPRSPGDMAAEAVTQPVETGWLREPLCTLGGIIDANKIQESVAETTRKPQSGAAKKNWETYEDPATHNNDAGMHVIASR